MAKIAKICLVNNFSPQGTYIITVFCRITVENINGCINLVYLANLVYCF